jgi:hypothetical protein
MKQAKKDPIEQNPAFKSLQDFETIDIGGISEALINTPRYHMIIKKVANKWNISENKVREIISNKK